MDGSADHFDMNVTPTRRVVEIMDDDIYIYVCCCAGVVEIAEFGIVLEIQGKLCRIFSRNLKKKLSLKCPCINIVLLSPLG